MAIEHSSLPGQSADIVTSVMAGITMNVEKLCRKIVMKRWLNPENFSISLSLSLSLSAKAKEPSFGI
jgi:hypothetical protein